MTEGIELSIIIKALNEEENIVRSIRSAKKALKEVEGLKGEVILADSLSTDRTIELTKNEGEVTIVSLKHEKDRSCGVGPQLGYQQAKGKYIYILDADMELEEGFLPKAMEILQENPNLAGVAGQVKEMRTVNIQFKRRAQQTQKNKPVGLADRLEMGGLYRKSAIETTGYLSNRNLHAYEEAELGRRLTMNNWKLLRIDQKGIRHYGYNTTSLGAFTKRWKTRYVKGSGDYLKASIGKDYFWNVVLELKIYVFVAAWWATLAITLLLTALSTMPLFLWTALTLTLLLLFLLKKRHIKEWAFSLVSWHISAAGLIWGLLSRQEDPHKKIPCTVMR